FFRCFGGIITSTNVNYAELLWEEFIQAIQTFLTDKANLGSPTKKGRKDNPYVIPYCRFTKLIICKADEVFTMPIPKELISNNIINASYYNAYLEMVAKHNRNVAAEKEGKKKHTTAKQPKPKFFKDKSSKPAPAPKPKLVDEPDEEPAHHEPEPEPEYQEATQPLPVVEGKGKTIAIEEQDAHSMLALHTPKRRSTTNQFILQRWSPATEEASTGPSTQPQDDASTNIVHESPSSTNAETDNQVNLEEKTAELDQGQVRSDPGKTPESRPQPEQEFIKEDQATPDPRVSRVVLVGPNPEPIHEEFMANVYPNVHGSLKLPADEHVILEEPLSSYGTLSSMKNLDDAYTFDDLFLNDKSTEDESGKHNMDSEVVSMVTILIHQVSSLISSLSTPIIDLSPPKLVSSTTQPPIFTTTTMTTATTTFVKEAVHIALQAPLKDRFREPSEADMKEILHQRIFESGSYKSLPEHVALYESLEASMDWANKDEFLAEKDMIGKKKLTLYESLEASMDWANKDEFLAEKDMSHKKCCGDQDPPPPPPDSDLSKKRIHDSGTSGSTQPSAPQSSA
nr:hypothetical protein [Tanacetum cinerariifolium]